LEDRIDRLDQAVGVRCQGLDSFLVQEIESLG